MRVERVGPHVIILGNNSDLVGTQFFDSLLQGRTFSVVADPPYGLAVQQPRMRYSFQNRQRGADRLKPIHGDDVEFDPTPWLLGVDQLFWGANHFAHHLPHNGRWLSWDKRCNIIPQRMQADIELAWCSEYGAARQFYHYWDGMLKQSEQGESRVHPTQKPVELMSWCLQYAKGEVIFDPYMGSGTTGVAACKAGRPFIGVEIEAEYFEAALKRMRTAYAQPDFFVAQGEPHETMATEIKAASGS